MRYTIDAHKEEISFNVVEKDGKTVTTRVWSLRALEMMGSEENLGKAFAVIGKNGAGTALIFRDLNFRVDFKNPRCGLDCTRDYDHTHDAEGKVR
jgi:hypothetical protein